MTQLAPAFFADLRRALGNPAVDTSEETIARYGRNLLPGGDRRPAGVVYSASTADVQTIVRLANQYRMPLYSLSTGENSGLGLKSPIRPGCTIVDVGARMNRILEIDETLCFAEIEPGVTYQQMYDELGRRGRPVASAHAVRPAEHHPAEDDRGGCSLGGRDAIELLGAGRGVRVLD